MYDYNDAVKASTTYFNGDELAASVFVGKYALRDDKGVLVESTPDQMHRRLAKEFARIETKYPNSLSEDEIFSYFDRFKYIVPQGSPMSAIGNPYQIQSCSNCFVIDSPEDSYGGILKTDQEQAQIMKRRGGVGTDISNIRPKGLETKNSARTTDGIGVFMERFSNTCREVAQNGRRGALMLTLNGHHPEISTFINIKKDKKKVTGANISVRLSDEFMNAVVSKGKVNLRWPVDSAKPKVSVDVDATDVWNEIIDAAWDSAEPGLLFWDTARRRTPSDAYTSKGFGSISTNPCLPEDTWIMTDNGPKQIKDLVNTSFNVLVNNSVYTSEDGFWCTGKKKTIILETKQGFKIECTPEHKVLTVSFKNRNKIKTWKMAKEIIPGDLLDLQNHNNTWVGNGSFEEGYLLGSLIGDGCISGDSAYLSWWGGTKEYMHRYVSDLLQKTVVCRSDLGSGNINSDYVNKHDRIGINSVALKELAENYNLNTNKNISVEIEKSSYNLYKGLLMGWFDADGTLNCSKEKQRCDIRLTSINLNNLYAAQRMLARMGIISKIYQNRKEAGTKLMPDGKGGNKEYYCQALHELIITKDNIKIFSEKIGFADPIKAEKLKNLISSYVSRGLYKEKYTAEVVSINEGSEKEVYDCTVNTVHCFDANGITTHNCGEIILSAYDSCRLMCINLYNFVKNPFYENATFDWVEYKKVVKIAQRLMDDMIDIELEQIDKIIAKINSDPESEDSKIYEKSLWNKIREACINGRRTGLGITALGDTLAALGMRYGSDESIKMTEEIYKELAISSYISSAEMARDRGTFPIFDRSLEENHVFIQQIRTASDEFNDLYLKYGRRNIANTTTAPTGSVSTLTQTTSGIEPAYLVFYTRRKKINPTDASNPRVDFIDDLGDKWQEFPVFHHHFKTWMKAKGIEFNESDNKAKTAKDLDFYADSPYCNSTSNDINWMDSVQIQAVAQKWICHAISKTCNLPNNATKQMVSDVYMQAWKSGCKGFTVYRDGCRSGVLVSEKETIKKTQAPKRPKSLDCDIYHTKANGEEFFVLVSLYEGIPYEVFAGKDKNNVISHGKHGKLNKNRRGHYSLVVKEKECIENVCDLLTDEQAVITRLISLSLRHGAGIEFVVDQLEKSPGGMTSYGKALSRVLKKYIPDGLAVTGQNCANCGSPDMVRAEGCLTCKSCGNSKCS